ncbi:MAG: hypothetical protein LBR39_05010 [Coriobacteriales bacterium]|jgi:Flp pilus assembly pilin Flp|nr:hypothetical protein [Coriobacteriales bacterium]
MKQVFQSVRSLISSLIRACRKLICRVSWSAWLRLNAAVRNARGQGTTEYAILVGVLVVIAIIAVAAFRGKLQELWNSIAEGINGL